MRIFSFKKVSCLSSYPFLIFALCALSCTRANDWKSASGSVWGTTYHIIYNSDRDLSDSIVSVTSLISESLSMFDRNSTVSRINRGETDSVDAFFADVYGLSQAVYAASRGKFDPTVAPLVDLWGFGRSGKDVSAPDSAAVARTLEYVGLSRSTLDGNRILKDDPRLEFDFSAVAKGYGVDKVAAMLNRNGCSDYMVEIGGEIRLAGHNPRGRDWRIQIDAPVQGSNPGDSALSVLTLTDCAVATSGNYRNFRQLAGDSIIGHTIDPLTGMPSPQKVLSATVIAPDCALADALATALMASEPAGAQEIINPFPGVKAFITLPSGKSVTFSSEK